MNRVTLLVCGGRDYRDGRRVFAVLDDIHRRRTIARIIHGNEPGAETLAGQWATSRDVEVLTCIARRQVHGLDAISLRDRKMFDFRPHGLVVFPGRKRTAELVQLAREFGVPVREID